LLYQLSYVLGLAVFAGKSQISPIFSIFAASTDAAALSTLVVAIAQAIRSGGAETIVDAGNGFNCRLSGFTFSRFALRIADASCSDAGRRAGTSSDGGQEFRTAK
jgi:hypothetical protein